MTSPGPWQVLSRVAAVALAVLLGAAIVVGVLLPYLDWRAAAAAAVEREAALVARYRALAARDTAAGPAELPSDPQLEALLLPATSEGQAMAALQDRLKAMSAAAGLTLVSVQPMTAELGTGSPPGAMPEALRRLTVRLKLGGDTGQLSRFLYEVESAKPWLLVDNLFVNARSGRAVGPGAGLDVQVDVSAMQAKGGG